METSDQRLSPYDTIFIFHDGENCCLPSRFEERTSAGNLVQTEGQISFLQYPPPGQGSIKGTTIYQEVLREAIACKIGSHLAREMDVLKEVNHVEYYFVLRHNPTNPFHPSQSTLDDLCLCEVRLINVPSKKDSVDSKIKELMKNSVNLCKRFSPDALSRTLFVLISGDRDFSVDIVNVRRARIDIAVIHSLDHPLRKSVVTLLASSNWSSCSWLNIVAKGRQAGGIEDVHAQSRNEKTRSDSTVGEGEVKPCRSHFIPTPTSPTKSKKDSVPNPPHSCFLEFKIFLFLKLFGLTSLQQVVKHVCTSFRVRLRSEESGTKKNFIVVFDDAAMSDGVDKNIVWLHKMETATAAVQVALNTIVSTNLTFRGLPIDLFTKTDIKDFFYKKKIFLYFPGHKVNGIDDTVDKKDIFPSVDVELIFSNDNKAEFDCVVRYLNSLKLTRSIELCAPKERFFCDFVWRTIEETVSRCGKSIVATMIHLSNLSRIDIDGTVESADAIDDAYEKLQKLLFSIKCCDLEMDEGVRSRLGLFRGLSIATNQLICENQITNSSNFVNIYLRIVSEKQDALGIVASVFILPPSDEEQLSIENDIFLKYFDVLTSVVSSYCERTVFFVNFRSGITEFNIDGVDKFPHIYFTKKTSVSVLICGTDDGVHAAVAWLTIVPDVEKVISKLVGVPRRELLTLLRMRQYETERNDIMKAALNNEENDIDDLKLLDSSDSAQALCVLQGVERCVDAALARAENEINRWASTLIEVGLCDELITIPQTRFLRTDGAARLNSFGDKHGVLVRYEKPCDEDDFIVVVGEKTIPSRPSTLARCESLSLGAFQILGSPVAVVAFNKDVMDLLALSEVQSLSPLDLRDTVNIPWSSVIAGVEAIFLESNTSATLIVTPDSETDRTLRVKALSAHHLHVGETEIWDYVARVTMKQIASESTIQWPTEWTGGPFSHSGSNSQTILVDVAEGSLEWQHVDDIWRTRGSHVRFSNNLWRIQRVQNPVTWTAYFSKVKSIANNNSSSPSCAISTVTTDDCFATAKECWLKFGSNSTDPRLIIDEEVGLSCVSVGSDFTEDAATADRNRFDLNQSQGQMFLMRVVEGDEIIDRNKCKSETVQEDEDGVSKYQTNAAYPAYLLTYSTE